MPADDSLAIGDRAVFSNHYTLEPQKFQNGFPRRLLRVYLAIEVLLLDAKMLGELVLAHAHFNHSLFQHLRDLFRGQHCCITLVKGFAVKRKIRSR